MFIRFPLILFLVCAFVATGAWLRGADTGTSFVRERSGLGEQRVQQKMWSPGAANSLTDKRFPLKEWNKHFSSVGSKRAAISTDDRQTKKKFSTRTREFPIQHQEMSQWDGRMKKLQEQARIATDDSAQKFADAQLYGAMLEGTRAYEELGEELSLRDINRFQFRRNRPDGAIPVDQAGGAAER